MEQGGGENTDGSKCGTFGIPFLHPCSRALLLLCSYSTSFLCLRYLTEVVPKRWRRRRPTVVRVDPDILIYQIEAKTVRGGISCGWQGCEKVLTREIECVKVGVRRCARLARVSLCTLRAKSSWEVLKMFLKGQWARKTPISERDSGVTWQL